MDTAVDLHPAGASDQGSAPRRDDVTEDDFEEQDDPVGFELAIDSDAANVENVALSSMDLVEPADELGTTRGDELGDLQTRNRYVITVMSPKGGTGKTTIATNLAVALEQRHPGEVVVVDIDLQFGDVGGALRLLPDTTIVDLAHRWPVDSVGIKLHLTQHHTGLLALCAPEDPADADEVSAAHIESILALLSASFRYVVVDSDPGLSEGGLSALDCSTDVVMVCSTDVHSVRGLRKATTVMDLIGMTRPRRHFVLNRADAKVNLTIDDIESAVGRRADVLVPVSREIAIGANEGTPIVEAGTPPNVVRAFEQLVARFEPIPELATSAGGIGRLFRRSER